MKPRLSALRRPQHDTEPKMKHVIPTICFAIPAAFAFSCTAVAQAASSTGQGGDSTRVQKKIEAVEAARSFKPGEGDPEPPAKPAATSADREVAVKARNAEGAAASKAFEPGEGDPKPGAKPTVARSDRIAARQALRAEVIEAMRTGTFPVYGADWGGRTPKK